MNTASVGGIFDEQIPQFAKGIIGGGVTGQHLCRISLLSSEVGKRKFPRFAEPEFQVRQFRLEVSLFRLFS